MRSITFLKSALLKLNSVLLRILNYSWHDSSRFRGELKTFKDLGGIVSDVSPMFDDWNGSAGQASGHYFHQDLLVAQQIHERKPRRHLDFGGRFDGFVAHVASFRHIEVCDIRDMSDPIKNFSFLRADLLDAKDYEITDSLSCLHSIEHIGLGRYGDSIDPQGHLKAFKNLVKMLEVGGILYISFPIARESQVVFNKHRIFEPREILRWDSGQITLKLNRFDFVDDSGKIHTLCEINDAVNEKLTYGCGIYTLERER